MDSLYNYEADLDQYLDDEYWYDKFINLKNKRVCANSEH